MFGFILKNVKENQTKLKVVKGLYIFSLYNKKNKKNEYG